jgi:antibiotic biosynthesis monooxygenase
MYAVVVNVSIAPGQFATARKALNEQVVPRAKQAPGFVKGYWTVRDDSSQGTSMTVFRTKQDADNAVTMVRSTAPPPGVTLNSAEVREVIAEG